LLTFGGENDRQKAGDGNTLFLTLAGFEELHQWTSNLKNIMRTFLVATSCSLSDLIAPKDGERSSSKVA
jgi:hypothetical protein